MSTINLTYDPELITEEILGETLRDLCAGSRVSHAWLGARLGLSSAAIQAMIHGRNLRQPVQLFALLDILGYDVVFRKRSHPPRRIRLT